MKPAGIYGCSHVHTPQLRYFIPKLTPQRLTPHKFTRSHWGPPACSHPKYPRSSTKWSRGWYLEGQIARPLMANLLGIRAKQCFRLSTSASGFRQIQCHQNLYPCSTPQTINSVLKKGENNDFRQSLQFSHTSTHSSSNPLLLSSPTLPRCDGHASRSKMRTLVFWTTLGGSNITKIHLSLVIFPFQLGIFHCSTQLVELPRSHVFSHTKDKKLQGVSHARVSSHVSQCLPRHRRCWAGFPKSCWIPLAMTDYGTKKNILHRPQLHWNLRLHPNR